MSKLAVVIQRHLVMNRCSGHPCMDAFYKREGAFASYEEDVRYMPVTCGGCCGAEVAAKLENLTKHLKRRGERKEDVVVHFASCVCSDNSHRPPCPHLDYMRQIAGAKAIPSSWARIYRTQRRKSGKLGFIKRLI